MAKHTHNLRSVLFLLFLLVGLTWLAFPTRSASAATKQHCLALKPGKQLGLVSLGMGWSSLQALARQHKYAFKREGRGPVYQMGPYRLLLKGKGAARKVGFIDMRFTAKTECFRMGKKRLTPKGVWYAMAAQMGTCEPMQMNRGGNVIQCANGVMLLQSRAPGYRVFMGKSKPVSTGKPVCAGYVVRGGLVATAKATQRATKAKVSTLTLATGKHYCFGYLAVTTKSKPKDIPTMGQCETYKRRGATIVFCNHAGLAFVFGGPKLVLDHIDVYHSSHLPLPTKYPPLPKQR